MVVKKADHNEEGMNIPRRNMLRAAFGSALGLGLTGLGTIAALWTAAVARFLTPNVANRPSRSFKAGSPTDYAEGRVETRHRQSHGVWIVHGTYHGRPQIYALRTACTHLGCITIWQEGRQKFCCPCHGSAFTKDGINVEGPARRPLERCAIRLAADGRIEINTARTFREELGEWDEPESFVEG
jgi:cytochrome b6-f complex iron-sulfur subunit